MAEHENPLLSGENIRTPYHVLAAITGAIMGNMVSLAERVVPMQQIIERLIESIHRLQFDTVIPDCYTSAGAVELIAQDAELRTELESGSVGIITLDVRALKLFNDARSPAEGDGLLANTGGRLRDATDHAIRSHPQEVENERRSGSPGQDILIRLGGDEMAVLVRGITPEQLEEIAARIRRHFSVEKAIQTSQQGELPIIASIAASHAHEIEPELRGNAQRAFEELTRQGLNRLSSLKTDQYTEMWYEVRKVDPYLNKPADDRSIVEVFYRLCCPRFWQAFSS